MGGKFLGMKDVFNGPGGGCDSTLIGWAGFNTTQGIEGGVGGLRYHTGIPNVKLGKFRVAMPSLLTMQDGGNRNGIVWIRNEPK